MTHLSAASTSTLHTTIPTPLVGVTLVCHRICTFYLLHACCIPVTLIVPTCCTLVAHQLRYATNLLDIFPVERLAWYCSVFSCSVS